MFIVPITKMEPSLTLEELKKSEGSQLPSEGKEFGSFLKEAIREADQALQETSEMDRKLALGEIDDLLMIGVVAQQEGAGNILAHGDDLSLRLDSGGTVSCCGGVYYPADQQGGKRIQSDNGNAGINLLRWR